MTHKEKARELFLQGFNCSQAVCAAFCDVTGLSEEQALKISAGFGAGFGRMRSICGACSGMAMVAGLLYGYADASDPDVKGEHYDLIQKLSERFKEENGGSIICSELLQGLEKNPGTHPDPRTAEYYKKRPCLKIVESAAEILDEYIANH